MKLGLLDRILGEEYKPISTYTLIFFQLAIYAGLAGAIKDEVFNSFALTPAHVTYTQPFTYLFLHSSYFHLLLNVFMLWLFGRRVEREIGSVEFLLYFVGSGFAAAIMHIAIVWAFVPTDIRTQQVVGSSGAISGILGIYAIRFYRDKFTVFKTEISSSTVLMVWLAFNAVFGLMSLYVDDFRLLFVKISLQRVGWWAHLGGFIFGMGIAHISQYGRLAQREYLISQADASYRRGTLIEVAQNFEKLTEIDPTDPFAFAELGRTYALLGDIEQSLPNYEKSIRMYLDEKRDDLALERFTEIRSTWKEVLLDPKIHLRMCYKLEEKGRYEEAVEALNILAQGAPQTSAGETAALRIGEIYLTKLHRPVFAEAAFNRFLKRYPDSQWRQMAEHALAKIRGKQQSQT